MLPRLPRLWRRLAQAAHEVDRRRTDLVLTIGSPGFALRLQRRLAGSPWCGCITAPRRHGRGTTARGPAGA